MLILRYRDTPIDFTRKAFISSIFVASFMFLFLLVIFSVFQTPIFIAFVFFFIVFFFMFFFFINRPAYDILRVERQIESEIVSAIRFLILELRSERSLYNAVVNTSNNFVLIGLYFDEIVNDVKLGKTMESALTEAVERCPSAHLRSVYWQLLNSLQTGADVSESLEVLLDDIVDEQKIKIEEYGRELNALSLFYMMIAIIIPTIGLTILLAVLTFVGVNVTLWLLFALWLLLTLGQYLFLKFSSSRRPAVEAH